jgi:hypothetical protein
VYGYSRREMIHITDELLRLLSTGTPVELRSSDGQLKGIAGTHTEIRRLRPATQPETLWEWVLIDCQPEHGEEIVDTSALIELIWILLERYPRPLLRSVVDAGRYLGLFPEGSSLGWDAHPLASWRPSPPPPSRGKPRDGSQ